MVTAPSPPFLGRSQEQAAFRSVLLGCLPSWAETHLPTVPRLVNRITGRTKPLSDKPAIFLFYGEGGMGKTTLTRRLYDLTQKEFAGRVQCLFLDWEDKQKLNRNLQVEHDRIRPETVLDVLHNALADAGWGRGLEDYRQQQQQLQAIEAKVDKGLKNQPPENPLLNDVAKLGSQGVAFVIRQSTGMSLASPEAIEKVLKVSAEALSQARQFVQKTLEPQEYDLYAQPHERLGEALGQGLARLAQRQPLVLFLDTYEIVDRSECDYTLRQVMQHSGRNVIWVVSGRANLADSGPRGSGYFRGYKGEFGEERLYARALSEFSLEEVQQYLVAVAPDRPITLDQADSVARFSLGIPFVVNQAAVMYRDGKPIDEIVQPVHRELGKISARDAVINATCERFLVHCFGATEREPDLKAIHALALLRRPEPDLLRSMLNITDGLEQRLQILRERYSFILVDELRLDQKLATFLRGYLLNPMRRTEPALQRLHTEAIAWLDLQIEHLSQGITDTADRYQDQRLAELMLDRVYHALWQSEDTGWRELVPRFIESWQYDRTWARSLLNVAEPFGKDHQHRLQKMMTALDRQPDAEDTPQLLDDFTKLCQRQPFTIEQTLILQLQRGNWCYRQDNLQEALHLYLELANRLPTPLQRLKTDLAAALYALSSKFIWFKGASDARYSPEGEQAIIRAIELHPKQASYLYNKAATLTNSKRRKEAIASYQQAIALDPNDATRHNGLGNVYSDLKRYEEAIASYQQAIVLDPNYAYPHNGLGVLYKDLKRNEAAVASYQQAIALDPNYATPHYNLGSLYKDLKRNEEAIASYQQAIALEPNDAYPHNGLGIVYFDLKRYEEAIASYQQAIALDPNFAYPHNGLGILYKDLKRYEEAIASYQQAIALDPNYAYPHNNLGSLYDDLKRYEEAIASYQQAIALDPNYAAPHNNLGWTYLLIDQLVDSQTAFETAIKLDPENYSLWLNLGLVYAMQGNLDAAYTQWHQGLERFKNNNDWDNAVRALYTLALGNADQGIAAMQAVVAAGAAVGALQNVWGDAEILARCPQPPDGIAAMLHLLNTALAEAT